MEPGLVRVPDVEEISVNAPRVTINGRPLEEAAPPKERNERVIGATPQNAAGYSAEVSSVRFDQGARVRISLRHYEIYVRHLDITSEILRDLLPLLVSMNDEVVSLRNNKDPLWWIRVPISEFETRAEELTAEERVELHRDIRIRVSQLQSSWELTKDPAARAELQWASVKSRALSKIRSSDPKKDVRLVNELRPAGPEKAKKLDHLAHALGRVLREQLGAEKAKALFDEAKRIQVKADG
jgi:hypothetical protein